MFLVELMTLDLLLAFGDRFTVEGPFFIVVVRMKSHMKESNVVLLMGD